MNIKNSRKKSNSDFQSKIDCRVGIFGGGQLAQMMSLKAHELGLKPIILSSENDDPAALTTAFHFKANTEDPKAIKNFLQECDVCTFESEFLDGDLLDQLSRETGTPIYPHPQIMKQLQDRSSQKSLLESNKIPTAKHIDIYSLNDLKKAVILFGPDLVIKKRRFGYDGNGTFFLNVKNSSDSNFWEKLIKNNPTGFIAEKKINFKNEKAIILIRDQHRQILTFPLVESKQTHARCDWVMGPVKHKKLSPLLKKLHLFLKKINYVGAIAFELFDTGNELLVNEIAPRVHNSGHYSQNALEFDQFQLHIMAISGWKLPKLNKLLSPGFAMVNLIGETINEFKISSPINNHFHWYHKKQNRPGRKMGHINALASTPKLALSNALRDRKKIQK